MPRTAKQPACNPSPDSQQASPCAYAVTGQLQPAPPDELSGLYVFGQVTDRTRRYIPTKDNSSMEVITYTVQDVAGHRYFIDEFSPQGYNDIGTTVEIPVYVKTFKKRNGDIGYSFNVQQQLATSSRGVRF